MRQLSSHDATFLAMENPRVWRAHVVHRRGSTGRWTLGTSLRALVAARLHLIPQFRLAGWRRSRSASTIRTSTSPTDLDLDFHIRELAAGAPGDQGAARRARSGRLFSAAAGPHAAVCGSST